MEAHWVVKLSDFTDFYNSALAKWGALRPEREMTLSPMRTYLKKRLQLTTGVIIYRQGAGNVPLHIRYWRSCDNTTFRWASCHSETSGTNRPTTQLLTFLKNPQQRRCGHNKPHKHNVHCTFKFCRSTGRTGSDLRQLSDKVMSCITAAARNQIRLMFSVTSIEAGYDPQPLCGWGRDGQTDTIYTGDKDSVRAPFTKHTTSRCN
jgi:hypothetical protein